MRAGVIVRCEKVNAEEFLGNQIRELSSLLGQLELLSLNYDQQIIAFTQDLDLATSREKVEKLRLMTRSFDSEIIFNTGIFNASPITLVIQLEARVDYLTSTEEKEWGSPGW